MHRFPSEVVFDAANQVLQAATTALEGGETIHDLSACDRFDSSLLAVLLELKRRAQARGSDCRIDGASAKLRELAGLYNVEALLFGLIRMPA